MQNCDVIIVGGGIVGLAIACGLQDCGLQIIVLEKTTPDVLSSRIEHQLRTSAINLASEFFLRYLNVWSQILMMRAKSFHSIEIWERDSFGSMIFNHPRGTNHLGYIIENQVIRQALWERAQKTSNIILLAPIQLEHVNFSNNEIFITLKNGNKIRAQLLILADGSDSWLRKKTSISLTFWNYDHHALIANIRTEQPHQSVARQTFYNNGILAFLPLGDPHLCSVVWSLPPKEAEKARKMSPSLFNSYLSTIFDMRLGKCQLESKRQTIHLIARYVHQFAAHRLALAGDAAHTMHPLLGQGINLGLMDAAHLIGEIRRLHHQGKDIGQYFYLRRYDRNRKYRSAVILASIQSILELFTGANLIKKFIRNVGLKLFDNIPEIKLLLLKEAMGLHELPNWLRHQSIIQ